MNQILCLLMSIVLTFADGTEKVYDDAEVTAVEIDDDTNTVTVNTTHGTDTYKDMVLAIGTRADEPAPAANNLITLHIVKRSRNCHCHTGHRFDHQNILRCIRGAKTFLKHTHIFSIHITLRSA